MKKRFLLIISAILLLLVGTSCSANMTNASSVIDSAAPSTEPTPTLEPTSTPTPVSSAYTLGTPFTVDDISYTLSLIDGVDLSAFDGSLIFNIDVQMFTDAKGDQVYSPADSSLKFMTVIVDIKSNGTKAVDPLALLNCTVKDSVGTEYKVAFSPTEAEAVETGESGKVDLVFAVKEDASTLTLDMTPALTETVQVPLQ